MMSVMAISKTGGMKALVTRFLILGILVYLASPAMAEEYQPDFPFYETVSDFEAAKAIYGGFSKRQLEAVSRDLRFMKKLVGHSGWSDEQWNVAWRQYMRNSLEAAHASSPQSRALQRCSIHARSWIFLEHTRLLLIGYEPTRPNVQFRRGSAIARQMQKILIRDNNWSKTDEECVKFTVTGIKVMASGSK